MECLFHSMIKRSSTGTCFAGVVVDDVVDSLKMHVADTHSYFLLDLIVNVPRHPRLAYLDATVRAGHSVSASFSLSLFQHWISSMMQRAPLVPYTIVFVAIPVKRIYALCNNSTIYRTLLCRAYSLKYRGKCHHCIAAAAPPSNCKMSIANILHDFNNFVCVDRSYLDELVLFQVMDSYSRFPAALSVSSKFLKLAFLPLSASGSLNFGPLLLFKETWHLVIMGS